MSIFYKTFFITVSLITILALTSFTNASGDQVSYEYDREKKFFAPEAIIVEGNKKIEKEAILNKINSKKGKRFSLETIHKDIENLYKMKYFETVEVLQRKVKGKNFLVYRVFERPIIKKITYQGNDEISTDDLKEKVKSKEFSILDVNAIKNDVEELTKLYEEKGFYLASVQNEVKKINDENVEVVFKIKEFDKIKVKKVTILGNKALSDDEIKNVMQTREDSLLSFMSNTGNFRDFNFKTDIERIKYFYKTKGFLQVNIGEPNISVSEDKRWLFISFKIQEGPQFSINHISYQGDMLFEKTKLIEKTTLNAGEIYSEQTLREDIQNLTELYQDKGYAFANVNRNLDIIPGENKVDVTFFFEKGKMAYFGKITVKGNTKTRDKVIRRELKVIEGMKFSGSKLRESKENVNRLGFFEPESVIFNTVASNEPGKDNILDLEISVKERSTGQIQVGAGYSSGSEGFIQASVTQHNFRGLGQDLSFTLNLAKKTQNYNIGFHEPYLFDSKWTAGADIFYTYDRMYEEFHRRMAGGDIRVGHPIFDYTRLFMTYKIEETKLTQINDPKIDPNLENGLSSSLESKIVYDKRNNRWETTKGHYLSTAYEYFGIGGDHYWSKTELDGRFYYPVWGDLIFKSRILTEKLFPRANPKHPEYSGIIPYNARFRMGGPRNLRGYRWGDIGPKSTYIDKDGRLREYVAGGQFSFLTTIELEHPLVKEAGLKWVVFADAGNVYDKYMGREGNYDLRADWGFGFRWFSPIGPLRFEFGYPIGRKEGESENIFHFDIGQPF